MNLILIYILNYFYHFQPFLYYKKCAYFKEVIRRDFDQCVVIGKMECSVHLYSSPCLGLSHSVKYLVEIENFTDQVLLMARSEIHSGYFDAPPTPEIMPGRKESYNGVKG